MVIQRIQTLYLLLVAVLSAVTAFVTVGTLSPDGDAMPAAVTPFGASTQVDDAACWWPAAILIAAAAVAVWAILSFKRLLCHADTRAGVTERSLGSYLPHQLAIVPPARRHSAGDNGHPCHKARPQAPQRCQLDASEGLTTRC